MKRLVIIGAGGFGREMAAWARESVGAGQDWVPHGFIDDNVERAREELGLPWLGTIRDHTPTAADLHVCAIGSVAAKRRCIELVRARGGVFSRVVHRTAVLGDRVRLGAGVIIGPLAVVSTDATLGDFVTLNYHSSVAHDAVVGEFCQIHCHVDITGSVRLGRGVLVGSRASLLPGCAVGDHATIGAGSVVLGDVPAGMTAFGIPARIYPPAAPLGSGIAVENGPE